MLDVEASARKCNQPSDLYLQLFATALQRFPSFSVTDVSRSSSPRHTRSSLCRAASHRAMKPPRLTKQQLQTKGNRAGLFRALDFKNISMTARSLNILHRVACCLALRIRSSLVTAFRRAGDSDVTELDGNSDRSHRSAFRRGCSLLRSQNEPSYLIFDRK